MASMSTSASSLRLSAPSSDRSDPGLGVVLSIHVTDRGSQPLRPVERIRAIAGVGLDGDRYALGTGRYSGDPKVDRQVTLIEAEEIEALEQGLGIVLAPGETRRNVTTRGIGDVECEGTRLCEPCQYLTDLLGKPVLAPLVHRAGLRALILTDGEIASGDEVVALD